jgi:cyclic dehypoxanthinyl futalosine synthase
MPISPEQALDCFASDDLIGIGMEADAIRRRLHPEAVVTYTVDAMIDPAAPILPPVEAAIENGATGIILRTPTSLDLDTLGSLLKSIRGAHSTIRIQALSAPEILALAATAKLTPEKVLSRLAAAGLDTFPGAGGSPISPEPWLAVHRAAHKAGIFTTAEMLFGAGESMSQRVAFLESLRTLQGETQSFLAFTLTSAPSPNGRDLDDPTAVEYLKTLAICRMMLDNIQHIQTSAHHQGLKVLQMSLRFGGNDAGSVHPIAISQHSQDASEEEVRRIIRDAGFRPAQRDTFYRTLFLN